MSENVGSMDYVELHCHSHYSLLTGASAPGALVARAHELGMPALALTDRHGLYGAVPFWLACRKIGIQPVIGAELTLEGAPACGSPALVLLARNQGGYRRLCRLITQAHLAGDRGRTPTGGCRLPLAALEQDAAGLIALDGGPRGAIGRLLAAGRRRAARALATRLARIFERESFWIEMQRHLLPGEEALLDDLEDLAADLGLGLVATNDVHYARRNDADLQDALICIREGLTIDQPHPARLRNAEYFLKSGEQLTPLLSAYPEALANSALIARRCEVSLDFTGHRLPPFAVRGGLSPIAQLQRLCYAGLRRRYPRPSPEAPARLAHELAVIERLDLAPYFLIVHDIVAFARGKGILIQGRGSAADSLAVYCLGITPVDPLAHNLLFDRFLNEGRSSPPDIDLDIQNDRREEVIQYVYERYGREHTAMVCNHVTFRPRSALRDLGRVLVFPAAVVDRLARNVDTWRLDRVQTAIRRLNDDDPRCSSRPWETLIRLCEAIDGCPRHLSIHVGGMLITARPLMELVPLERAAMPGRVVVQWDKDGVEDAGLIKIDLLGLGMLSLVAEAGRLVRLYGEEMPAQEDMPLDDPEIYAMLRRGDSIGCFQVESRAQQQMVHKHRPETFNDIVVQVAIVRPGPIQGNMVHPYLRRRQGLEPVRYLHGSLQPILEDTLGIVLYQEQVIQIATEVAGFNAADADRLRRAMSDSRSDQAMEGLQQEFEAGCRQRGLSAEEARTLFDQIRGFGQYGFCRSHAACFALLAYQSLWLKRYHALPFYCALLNNQPMGFYAPAVVVGDARRHRVSILPVDVRYSGIRCTIEDGGLRLGYSYVRGIGPRALQRLGSALAGGPFRSVVDFWARSELDLRAMTALAQIGAFDSFCMGDDRSREGLIWDLPLLGKEAAALRGQRILVCEADESVELPEHDEQRRIAAEQEVLGLTTGTHPFRLLRTTLPATVAPTEALRFARDGQVLCVAGFAVCRQRPGSAHGFVFLTLEDEMGLANVIVRPALYERERDLARRPLVVVEAVTQREGRQCTLLARRFLAVETLLRGPAAVGGYEERAVHSWR